MGNTQSYLVASLSAWCVYLGYVHIYRAYKLSKQSVLSSDLLPGFAYLNIKYVSRALVRRTGFLYPPSATHSRRQAVRTVIKCRLQTALLRRFCSAAGYGWDYPDTEFRDIPLCFPQFLCGRLLLMALTDDNFRLSPAGLVPVCQTLKTFQPIDELKKGPFMLQVQVLEYRHVGAGVEVDICMSATARTGCPVWESILTLLSKNKLHKDTRCLPMNENKSEQQSDQPDEPVPETMKQVEVRVPWSSGLQCLWSPSDCSPYGLISLPARLFGYRSHTTPSLWMLSVCLAEIEKHKGVEVITAPVSITAQFKESFLVPGKATITFWEKIKDEGQSPFQGLNFHMQQHGGKICHLEHNQYVALREVAFHASLHHISLRNNRELVHSCSKGKHMERQRNSDTASIPLSSPTGSIGVEVYHEYQEVAFMIIPENGHVTENRRDQVTGRDHTSKMPDIQPYSLNEAVQRNSTVIMDWSSLAYSGPEDDSTDPHETLTETSTLTFVDTHPTEEAAENHSLHGVGMVYLKEFVLIDDDDDGDMSLREKTVTDMSIVDGKAADLVCGRLLSTSSGSVDYKDKSPACDTPLSKDGNAHGKKHCCFCTIL